MHKVRLPFLSLPRITLRGFLSLLRSRLMPRSRSIFALLAILLAGSGTISATPPVESHDPRVILNMGKTRGLVFSPTPEYPKEALKKHWGGSGLFEVQFRRDGLASAVFVTLSTGHKVLDDSVTRTLRQWRSWKGYRFIVVAVPITFAPGDVEKPARKKQ